MATYNVTYLDSSTDEVAQGINIEANSIGKAETIMIKAKPDIQIISIVDLDLLNSRKVLVANEYFKNQINNIKH